MKDADLPDYAIPAEYAAGLDPGLARRAEIKTARERVRHCDAGQRDITDVLDVELVGQRIPQRNVAGAVFVCIRRQELVECQRGCALDGRDHRVHVAQWKGRRVDRIHCGRVGDRSSIHIRLGYDVVSGTDQGCSGWQHRRLRRHALERAQAR